MICNLVMFQKLPASKLLDELLSRWLRNFDSWYDTSSSFVFVWCNDNRWTEIYALLLLKYALKIKSWISLSTINNFIQWIRGCANWYFWFITRMFSFRRKMWHHSVSENLMWSHKLFTFRCVFFLLNSNICFWEIWVIVLHPEICFRKRSISITVVYIFLWKSCLLLIVNVIIQVFWYVIWFSV